MVNYYSYKKYVEKLRSGGEFFIIPEGWGIYYYFSGPDLRWNGETFIVDGLEIDDYIKAWKDNYTKYSQLKESIPVGGEFSTVGELGMGIYIGGYREGVTISKNIFIKDMYVKSELELKQILEDYERCKAKYLKLSTVLF